jgi:7,8-dihydropterin-6-yl-methyl-4-(beta-D-ribofuranosyl)aminobenzene 5'-phosphate synthase
MFEKKTRASLRGLSVPASIGAVIGLLLPISTALADDGPLHEVTSLEITILSTMLTEQGVGEWGFAALVEADGKRILFDTGARPDTVLLNIDTLGIDLSDVEDVVLSHNHGDHTGGLVSLRRELSKKNPKALSRAHVGRGIFWERQARWITMAERKASYEQLGGTVIEHDEAVEIHPGIWLTGPVPRVHPERNYGNPFAPESQASKVRSPQGLIEDNIPESMSMVINTPKGLVVVSGCGHAGMINTVEYARKITRPAEIHAAFGGFHLLHGSDDHLAWTAEKLRELGLQNFVGAHCTGIEPVYRLRELAGLDRSSSVVGAIGASFSLRDGIDPLALAH